MWVEGKGRGHLWGRGGGEVCMLGSKMVGGQKEVVCEEGRGGGMLTVRLLKSVPE